MNLTDLTRIDKAIDIQAPPERVWRALTTPREVSEWFRMTIEGAMAQGEEFWMTSVSPGYEGQRGAVRVVEMVAPRRLVWHWHPGQVDPSVDYAAEPMTTVTFTLEPSDTGTTLRVAETGFDEIAAARRASVHADNTMGWAEVVVWLKTYVEASR
jgi:uncharacterized protein YndB with AHSA1/START domain